MCYDMLINLGSNVQSYRGDLYEHKNLYFDDRYELWKFVRRMASSTIWICYSSCANCVFHILPEVGAKIDNVYLVWPLHHKIMTNCSPKSKRVSHLVIVFHWRGAISSIMSNFCLCDDRLQLKTSTFSSSLSKLLGLGGDNPLDLHVVINLSTLGRHAKFERLLFAPTSSEIWNMQFSARWFAYPSCACSYLPHTFSSSYEYLCHYQSDDSSTRQLIIYIFHSQMC